MSEAANLDTLRTVPFLEGLTDEELQQLASVAKVEQYPAETIIFREGETEHRFFFVLEGSVALEVKVPQEGYKRIHTVDAGQLLGWSPLLDLSLMTATARTVKESRLAAFNVDQVSALCRDNAMLGFKLMKKTAQTLAQSLNDTHAHILNVYLHNVPLLPASLFEGAD